MRGPISVGIACLSKKHHSSRSFLLLSDILTFTQPKKKKFSNHVIIILHDTATALMQSSQHQLPKLIAKVRNTERETVKSSFLR